MALLPRTISQNTYHQHLALLRQSETIRCYLQLHFPLLPSVDQNLSVLLKHNIDEVNYDDPIVQKVAIHYLLEKVRDLQTLFIQSGKEKKSLQDEVSALYKQNDVLSAENVTMRELISSLDDRNRSLTIEMDTTKKEF